MAEAEGPRLVWSRSSRFVREPYEAIEPRNSDYLIKGIFPMRGVGFIAGASKGGKTFVALDWSQKLATGATVMGRKARQVGVVYVGAEDADGCRARIKAWKRRYPRQSYTPFEFLGQGVDLRDDDQVEELISELRAIAETFEANGHSLGMVVIDTLARCMPGADENGSSDGGLVLKAVERIEAETEVFVLVVAHHGKAGAENGIRGWSGFDAASDATVTVERDKDDPTRRSITLSKVKNGPDGDQVGFFLERQNLGVCDSDGEELWSCVVAYDHLPPEKTPSRKRRAVSAEGELVLTCLGRLIDNGHCQPVPSHIQGVRQGAKGVRRADLHLEAKVSGLGFDGEKPNTYDARFGRKVAELAGLKRIRQEGDLIWLI